jgi:hypothetical protein
MARELRNPVAHYNSLVVGLLVGVFTSHVLAAFFPTIKVICYMVQ